MTTLSCFGVQTQSQNLFFVWSFENRSCVYSPNICSNWITPKGTNLETLSPAKWFVVKFLPESALNNL